MNTPLRRVGLAMLAMIVLLLANATYIQIVKADDYRNDARNNRVLYEEYARQRGRIQIQSAFGGQIIANVTPTSDRLRYLRQYPAGPVYAPVTGFYSVRYGATGLERSDDTIEADRREASLAYLFKYAFRPGTVPVRELADHTPVNYLSAVMGLRP